MSTSKSQGAGGCVSLGGGGRKPVPCGSLALNSAREEYQRFDRMVVKFPNNAALDRARITAYGMWLQAVRNFRNGIA